MTTALKPAWQDIPEHIVIANLPESMRDFLHIIPMQAVLTIVEIYGGTKLYIPLNPKHDDGLGKLIGIQAAQAMASYAGGCMLEIPMLTKIQQRIRRAAVLDSLARGVSQRETARALCMTERNVRYIHQKYSK